MGLGAEGVHHTEAGLGIGEDPHHAGAAFDLLVQPLQHVDALQMLVVAPGETGKSPCLVDMVLNPVRELRVLVCPRVSHRRIPLGLREIPPVVEPAPFRETVVIGLAVEISEGVSFANASKSGAWEMLPNA